MRTNDKSLRVMAIGPVGAGKSTLLARLGLRGGPAKKTGGVEYHAEAVDTPGEAFEIPTLYHMLIMSSTKASVVLLLADPTKKRRFPARFALSMRAPIIGVVSKIDIATPENILRAEKTLAQSGVCKIFRVSSLTGEGIPDLESYLNRDRY